MNFTDYKPKADLPWWDHQAADLHRSADLPVYAHLDEQRTGKTRKVIDTACYWYEKGVIDTLIVVAWPLGVHRNWVMDDAPLYIPPRIDWHGVVWESSKARTNKTFQRELEYVLRFRGLRIVAIAAESIVTVGVRKYLAKLLDASKGAMLVADEFSFMESVDAERTMVMMRMRRYENKIKVVRILDGTPSGNRGPLGLFAPFTFMDHKILGHTSEFTFKMHFAEWIKKDFRKREVKEADTRPEAKRPGSLIQRRDARGNPIYKNIDELHRRLAPWSSRVTRKDVFPHLKDPIYQTAYVELTDEQRRVYDTLAEEYRAELRDGTVIKAEIVLTRYLRLQQIASNYFPETDVLVVHELCQGEGCEECDDLGVIIGVKPAMRIDNERNPRMERLLHEMGRTSDPMLIGAKFRQDGADIIEAAEKAGYTIRRFWGTLAQKQEAKAAFQRGDVQFLAGNQFSMSRGHVLSAARSLLFYSHDFALRTRLQFQDRPVTKDMKHALEIVDIVAVDTVDQRIIASLRNNKNLADMITGDPHGDWI